MDSRPAVLSIGTPKDHTERLSLSGTPAVRTAQRATVARLPPDYLKQLQQPNSGAGNILTIREAIAQSRWITEDASEQAQHKRTMRAPAKAAPPPPPPSLARNSAGSSVSDLVQASRLMRTNSGKQDFAHNMASQLDVPEEQRKVREAEDAQRLCHEIKDISFFAELPSHVVQHLCRTLGYDKYEPGTVVFEEGTRGDKVYIILSGSVHIHQVAAPQGINLGASMFRGTMTNTLTRTMTLSQPSASAAAQTNTHEAEGAIAAEPGNVDLGSDLALPPAPVESPHGARIAVLWSPCSFGEWALLSENGTRSATAVVGLKGAELLALRADDFHAMLSRLSNVVHMPERVRQVLACPPPDRSEDERKLLGAMLHGHKYLANMKKSEVADMCGVLTLVEFKENELIFNRGDLGTQFFIILKGSVAICVVGNEDLQRRNNEIPGTGIERQGSSAATGGRISRAGSLDPKRAGVLFAGDADANNPIINFINNERRRSFRRKGSLTGGPTRTSMDGASGGESHEYTVQYTGDGTTIVPRKQWRARFGEVAIELHTGDSFGERALTAAGERRTATAIASQPTQCMVLDKRDYLRLNSGRAKSQCSGVDNLRTLLRIKPWHRKEEDIDSLLTELQAANLFGFTKSMDPRLHRNICRNAQYLRKNKDEVLFAQGAKGDAFYVILSGTVSLHIRDKDAAPPAEAINGEPQDVLATYGPCVNVMQFGQSFGELALLHGMPRTGSVVAQEPTEFLVLLKVDYDRMLAKMARAEQAAKVAFLRDVPALRQWPLAKLVRLAYLFSLVKLPRNHVIYHQGDGSSDMYIVHKGFCRAMRKLGNSPLDVAVPLPGATLSLGAPPRPATSGRTGDAANATASRPGTSSSRPGTAVTGLSVAPSGRPSTSHRTTNARLSATMSRYQTERAMTAAAGSERPPLHAGMHEVVSSPLGVLNCSLRELAENGACFTTVSKPPGSKDEHHAVEFLFGLRDGPVRRPSTAPFATTSSLSHNAQTLLASDADLAEVPETPVALPRIPLKDMEVANLGPGEYFGELPALLNCQQPTTLITATETECYVANMHQVLKLLKHEADAFNEMRLGAQERLCHLEERIFHNVETWSSIMANKHRNEAVEPASLSMEGQVLMKARASTFLPTALNAAGHTAAELLAQHSQRAGSPSRERPASQRSKSLPMSGPSRERLRPPSQGGDRGASPSGRQAPLHTVTVSPADNPGGHFPPPTSRAQTPAALLEVPKLVPLLSRLDGTPAERFSISRGAAPLSGEQPAEPDHAGRSGSPDASTTARPGSVADDPEGYSYGAESSYELPTLPRNTIAADLLQMAAGRVASPNAAASKLVRDQMIAIGLMRRYLGIQPTDPRDANGLQSNASHESPRLPALAPWNVASAPNIKRGMQPADGMAAFIPMRPSPSPSQGQPETIGVSPFTGQAVRSLTPPVWLTGSTTCVMVPFTFGMHPPAPGARDRQADARNGIVAGAVRRTREAAPASKSEKPIRFRVDRDLSGKRATFSGGFFMRPLTEYMELPQSTPKKGASGAKHRRQA
ncbi:hypothetical protein WJX72_011866 [[Myrmecia] bisecta]|uniref:Cyclic nucleotide-binding domain-containing protein n=1 Tax=[Myrmecia] bisecta TaxID=41462 RepID=A0AAW1RA75_9CHLO